MKALNNHPLLNSVFQRAGSIVQALYKHSHRGYQKWHRIIDQGMAQWLNNTPNATEQQFWGKLYDYYNTPDMINRFGEGVLKYIKSQIK